MPEPDRDDVADIVADARAEMSWQESRTSKGVIFNSLQTVEAGAAQNGTAKARRPDPPILGVWESRPLDGVGNNRANPEWASAMTIYPRVAPAAYVDGLSQEPPGPGPRYISNRIFNNLDVMIYSPRNISDWMAVWGQFVDHTIVVRQGRRQTGEDGEICDIAYDNDDPLEQFPNALGVVLMNRSIAAPDTGQTCPRDQVNQHSSYIGAQTVYGDDWTRLEWLREGPADGNPEHAGARLLMRGGYLPRRDSRGDPENAPNMVFGAVNDPGHTAVAGDQRANENPMIMATQTLFAREHNRIVSLLPEAMPEEDKFQIARAVVIAEEQYITYNEFLPAVGLTLPPYTGYNPELDAGATNEFATIGYRGHAMIRGWLNVRTQASRYTEEAVDWLRQLDITVEFSGEEARLAIPMGFTTFFQPDLVEYVGVGPVLQGIGMHPGKNNDELMSNKIRSLTAPMSETTQAVNDLTAVDIARGRDHGLPSYNQVRIAYGLAPKTSFREITGEDSEDFPADPLLTPGREIDDPHSLDWVELHDINGNPTTPEADNAVRGVRRTPLAARLKGIYGDVDKVDAFIGMICEPHLPGCELGELQAAIWRREFTTLRDGDRFWYESYPVLEIIRRAFGIDYRTTLGDVIARNTDIPRHELSKNVFFAEGTPGNEMPKAEANGSGTAEATDSGAAGAGVPAEQNGKGQAAGTFDPLERRPWHCGVSEI
jgi:hypothetical protein